MSEATTKMRITANASAEMPAMVVVVSSITVVVLVSVVVVVTAGRVT
jgi:hypothetical protein